MTPPQPVLAGRTTSRHDALMPDETPAEQQIPLPWEREGELPFPRPPREYNFKPGNPGRPPGHENHMTAVTHDAIIDFILANPRASQKQIADAFHYTPGAIRIIMGSDSFQARYLKRQGAIVDPLVTATVEERLRGIANKAAEIVSDRLDTNPLDHKFALEALRTSAPALVKDKAPLVNASFVVHLPGPAASSAEWTNRFSPASGEVVKARLDDTVSEADMK